VRLSLGACKFEERFSREFLSLALRISVTSRRLIDSLLFLLVLLLLIGCMHFIQCVYYPALSMSNFRISVQVLRFSFFAIFINR